jgi:hypothetical protein
MKVRALAGMILQKRIPLADLKVAGNMGYNVAESI